MFENVVLQAEKTNPSDAHSKVKRFMYVVIYKEPDSVLGTVTNSKQKAVSAHGSYK